MTPSTGLAILPRKTAGVPLRSVTLIQKLLYLDEYVTAAGLTGQKNVSLFRTLGGRGRKQLTADRMTRQDARRMIVRRAQNAGLLTRIGCHSFRATGITVYLLNGGLLEYAQQMAAHESARTTKLYDRRNDQVTLDQVERIVL